ncbi:Dam family site-specific DNA-(adenine-N6)-methyltransferase [Photobacterium sp. ZSDE20]|uniref:Site-specific DNA-methyltransferase (adenine-specific) n=1 Tax=Photobacterium pectinilyticum TaxID=2906793 RepID=A0ABT1N7P4_9GAMM|nr:Dam family site-specific DNA-(adenine-N6)-methyltransferase [Photobacterium sp. ZSDE20]MCQ1060117.1 Dam family site-specific DNA-(adenine-N6)-methyltransferase [Photobacterium sp. ZSDE20]MDD1827573.1 Dam family site-specific DNA-(adenine-N6)-methyltransferase [Photobacterium sp. ZSDE20]
MMYRSPLKWAGGKAWLAKAVEPVVDKEWKVAEPFSGGLGFSLFFGFKHVHASDINWSLINFFQCLRDGSMPDIIQVEASGPFYYKARDRFNDLIEQTAPNKIQSDELSTLTWFINRHCFNGLSRFNKKGRFNVPYGQKKKLDLNSLELCEQFGLAAQHWTFSHGSYETSSLADADLAIIDPPYHDTFADYDPSGFIEEDQIKLVEWLDTQSVNRVIATNNYNKFTASLYREAGFSLCRAPVQRKIAAKGASRKTVFELVALKGFSANEINKMDLIQC